DISASWLATLGRVLINRDCSAVGCLPQTTCADCAPDLGGLLTPPSPPAEKATAHPALPSRGAEHKLARLGMGPYFSVGQRTVAAGGSRQPDRLQIAAVTPCIVRVVLR